MMIALEAESGERNVEQDEKRKLFIEKRKKEEDEGRKSGRKVVEQKYSCVYAYERGGEGWLVYL